ncbi:nuclear transport factor 2 family protein [Aureivirga sp. CE67]|uniref:nuclear transport factor 2 family protein n=1 Tax=Aureivirga sp. CE67 TaxID=1788983 RepID=UPI0018CBD1E5|nr:nuclear transport factor 2 family protein [Aureivirga sp. CE67]
MKEMNKAEEEVWKLEEKYWEVLTNLDLDSYLKLWDEELVAWPSWSENIRTKNEIGGSINFVKQGEFLEFSYTLKPYSVKQYDCVVISIYVVKYIFKNTVTNQIESSKSTRILHTWKKDNGAWKIIGGMNTDPV